MSVQEVSTVTSIFYLAMFVIGLFVTGVMKVFRKGTFIFASALVLGGMVMFVFTRTMALYVIASALVGLGNGLAQPIFYTKATGVVTNQNKNTLSLAYLQVANYVAISMVPVIIDFFADIFGQSKSNLFPFVIVSVFCAIVTLCVIIRVRHFTFGISKTYYE